MKILGAWMIAFGIFSILVGFVGLQFQVLWFLDEFGPLMGYVLKVGLIVAGIWVWRNADKIPAGEDEEPEGNNRAWIPVAVSGTVIVGIIAYVAISQLRSSWLDRQVNRPAPPATWASTPVNQWPALVLLQKAEFKHHTPMQAGCACLVRLPTGEIVALTAGHLLGKDGGVSPGFTRSGFGGLDPQMLATLTDEITSWELFLPKHKEQAVEAVGLFGKADEFDADCDQVLLRLSQHYSTYPVKPLDVRLKPVTFGEPLHLITCALDKDGNLQQVVLDARRVPGLGFVCELEKPAELNGCSGAPVVDKDGLLVGIVTGGTLAYVNNRSSTVRAFSGHLVSELTPLMKAAISRKKIARI
jgi:hypothetical protein